MPPPVATFLLKTDNVADAVAAVAPHGLDLCSSVRSEGRLDAAKLRDFFSALAQPPRAS